MAALYGETSKHIVIIILNSNYPRQSQVTWLVSHKMTPHTYRKDVFAGAVKHDTVHGREMTKRFGEQADLGIETLGKGVVTSCFPSLFPRKNGGSCRQKP